MDHIYSIGEVGRMLGIRPYRISYAIDTGQLPEAPFRFLHKRCFTEADSSHVEFDLRDRERRWI